MKPRALNFLPSDAERLVEAIAEQLMDPEAGHQADAAGGLAQRVADERIRKLGKRAGRLARKRRGQRRGFERRTARRWRDAMDRYFLAWLTCLELGEGAFHGCRDDLGADPDHLLEALVRLHARACRIALEVEALLRGGFPGGAGARGRTLHEIASVAFVLQEGGGEVAERFLLHAVVTTEKDARGYEEHAEALGLEPLEPGIAEELRAERRRLSGRFGSEYEKPYGWASPLFADKAPNFAQIEGRAGLGHLRPYYALASHDIHASGKGASMTVVDFRGEQVLTAGPMNSGFAEPGHGALISLMQTTLVLLMHCQSLRETGAEELLGMFLMLGLVDEAGEAFGRCQAAIDAAEAEITGPSDCR